MSGRQALESLLKENSDHSRGNRTIPRRVHIQVMGTEHGVSDIFDKHVAIEKTGQPSSLLEIVSLYSPASQFEILLP